VYTADYLPHDFTSCVLYSRSTFYLNVLLDRHDEARVVNCSDTDCMKKNACVFVNEDES